MKIILLGVERVDGQGAPYRQWVGLKSGKSDYNAFSTFNSPLSIIYINPNSSLASSLIISVV